MQKHLEAIEHLRPPLDGASMILEDIQLKGLAALSISLAPAMRIDEVPGLPLVYLQMKGQAFLTAPSCGLEDFPVAEGDLVLLFARGDQLSIAGDKAARCREVLKFGVVPVPLQAQMQGDPEIQGLLAFFSYRVVEQSSIFKLLPRQIHLAGSREIAHHWQQAVTSFLHIEMAEPRAGAAAMVARLIEIAVVRALREWIHSGALQHDQLTAMSDGRILRCVEALRADVTALWTVGQMAAVAAMSTSAFAERFKRVMGEKPGEYVKRLRLGRSRDLLAKGQLSISETAAAVGYESAAAFSRAFRHVFGVSPSEWALSQAEK